MRDYPLWQFFVRKLHDNFEYEVRLITNSILNYLTSSMAILVAWSFC